MCQAEGCAPYLDPDVECSLGPTKRRARALKGSVDLLEVSTISGSGAETLQCGRRFRAVGIAERIVRSVEKLSVHDKSARSVRLDDPAQDRNEPRGIQLGGRPDQAAHHISVVSVDAPS